MKKRKIFKTLAFSSLAACMFCLPILAGCAPAEMLPQNPEPGQNFDLGLNPETDPVVYTTASGLQIKKSDGKYSSTTTTIASNGATYTQDLRSFYYFTMGTFSGTIYTAETIDSTYTVSNEPVNWMIIGRGEMAVADSTPAGSAIQGDAGKQEIAIGSSIYENLNLSAIPENSDIPKGCFLVLSEKLLGQMYFNSSGALNYGLYTSNEHPYSNLVRGNGNYGGRYRYIGTTNTTSTNQSWNTTNNAGGSLYNYINSLFSKNNSTGAITGSNKLGFTQAQADMIIPQQLYTVYHNGTTHAQETPTTDGGTYYTMFPLAARGQVTIYQNYCIEDYFKYQNPTQEQGHLNLYPKNVATLIGSNESYAWYLRSNVDPYQYTISYIFSSGSHDASGSVQYSRGVRPAMVMKLS